MSIASELTLLGQDKTAIANAITAKGGTVNQGDGFHNFAADIATIPIGGDPNLYINQLLKNTLTSITEDMMSGVTRIRNAMFEENTVMTDITIPDTVVSIGNYAFRWCSGITSMYLPDSIGRNNNYYALGESFLNRCTSLSYVRLPTVYNLRLPYSCFGCESVAKTNQLESITIPANFSSIGSYVFSNCANLKSVTILRTKPPTLDNINAFNGTHANLRIYVPSGYGLLSALEASKPTFVTDRFYKFENDQYILLTSEPSDWDNNWRSYYETFVAAYQNASNWSTYASIIQATITS